MQNLSHLYSSINYRCFHASSSRTYANYDSITCNADTLLIWLLPRCYEDPDCRNPRGFRIATYISGSTALLVITFTNMATQSFIRKPYTQRLPVHPQQEKRRKWREFQILMTLLPKAHMCCFINRRNFDVPASCPNIKIHTYYKQFTRNWSPKKMTWIINLTSNSMQDEHRQS